MHSAGTSKSKHSGWERCMRRMTCLTHQGFKLYGRNKWAMEGHSALWASPEKLEVQRKIMLHLSARLSVWPQSQGHSRCSSKVFL